MEEENKNYFAKEIPVATGKEEKIFPFVFFV